MAKSSSREEFLEQYAELAKEQMLKYGIPASVTLAQAAVESADGKSLLTKNHNNFFGIHAVPMWINRGDPIATMSDSGVRTAFTKHASAEESFEYHSRFLLSNARQYGKCYSIPPTAANAAERWAQGINDGGYAEKIPGKENQYYTQLMGVIENYNLKEYDRQVIEEAKKSGLTVGYMRGSVTAERPVIASQGTNVSTTASHGRTADTGSQIGYHYPLDLVDGKLVQTDYYGRKPGANDVRSHVHTGVDLRARNVPVYATENQGRVVEVNTNERYQEDGNNHKKGDKIGSGKYVIVEYARPDGGNIRVSYCHLDSVDVKNGDIVSAGQSLGISGNTGNSQAPHLHLTAKRLNPATNQWVNFNPLDYLAEINVRGKLSGTVIDKGTGDDLLASRKAGVDTTPTPADIYLAQQTSQGQQNDMAENRQVSEDGQEQQIETSSGLLSYLFGDNEVSKKLSKMGIGDISTGDIVGDVIAACISGTVALVSMANGLSQQEMQEGIESQKVNSVQTVSTVVDCDKVQLARAEGVDFKQMHSIADMNAEANLQDLDLQKQQQRQMSLS